MSKTFWWLLMMACVAWYSVVTVYVAIKGAADIKSMLARLAANRDSENEKNQAETRPSG